jgi:two-component system response regulator VanR
MDIKVLVVEDDKHIRETVKAYLADAGYSVDTCADGNNALEKFYDNTYHLIILDIMLPGVNGHELLKELRKLHDTPVLMMTALDDDANEIKAFTNEADDYVTKPFTIEVLLKRAEALLRRSGVLKKEVCFGKLTLYPESYKAEYDGVDIGLTAKEFEILFLLIQNKNKVISHEGLLTKIWGYDFDGGEGTVHVNIKRLRDKLPVNIIKTVKGVGYCLKEEFNNEA